MRPGYRPLSSRTARWGRRVPFRTYPTSSASRSPVVQIADSQRPEHLEYIPCYIPLEASCNFELGKARLARDVGLIFMREWAAGIEVEIFDPRSRKKVVSYSYRPKADPNAKNHEPGSSKKFAKKKELEIRVVARINPRKPADEAAAFFREIGWAQVEHLIESGRGKIERDGGFRSGGFNVERWVYSDLDEEKEQGAQCTACRDSDAGTHRHWRRSARHH